MAGVLLLSLKLQAQQTTFESVSDFPKLYDITYDTSVQNKLYARTLTNHIVTSADNGVTWSVLYSSPTGIDDLKWVPGKTELSFITATGISIYNVTTNEVTATIDTPENGVEGAGLSWIDGYNIQDAGANVLVVNTGFKLDMFTNLGKAFYTNDGGTTWNEIYYTADNDNVFINDVAIAPNNPQKVFLSRGHGNTDIDGGLWTSTDGGATFTEQLEGVILDPIAFNPLNANDILLGTGIAFGESEENLYRSADGGTTWNTVDINWSDITLNNITKIVFHPTNDDKIILLEENEIVTTEDGGATWHNAVYPDTSITYYYGLNASYNPFNEDEILLSTDYYPQFTTDNGETLTQVNAPFAPASNVSISQEGETNHLYYSYQGTFFHKNLTTGESVGTDADDPNIVNGAYKRVVADPAVDGRVFILAGGGFMGADIQVSTDHGNTTANLFNTYADEIMKVGVSAANTNIAYLSVRSGDYGTLNKVNLTNPENITQEELVLPTEGVVTGIIVSATDANDITIAIATNLYHSADGGATWTTGAGVAADIIWDAAQSPADASHVLVSTNHGVFKSEDGGTTLTTAIADINVRKVAYSPLNANVAVAATYSGENVIASLLVTTNNGADWTTITPEQIKYVFTGSVDFAFTEDTVTAYIGTSDLGVMGYTIDLGALGTNNPVAQQNSVVMYPNPATNVLNVAASNNTFEIKNTVIYSITGQKVLESDKTTINVAGLQKGIYVVKTETTNGKTVTQKVVKE